MHITHVTRSLSRLGAGVSKVAWDLGLAQQYAGANVRWACHQDAHLQGDLSGLSAVQPDRIIASRAFGPRQLSFAPGFRRRITDVVMSSDAVHVHGIWSSACHVAASLANLHEKPFVVAPHGMLDEWALQHRAWRKRAARLLVEQRFLDGAPCLHALVPQEYQDIRKFNIKQPVAVIPNGVDLREFDIPRSRNLLCQLWPQLVDRPYALFLSRVHPKKGILTLLDAWSRAGQDGDWLIVIAGPDENGHLKNVARRANALGISDQVHYVGPVYGIEKAQLLKHAEFFVLPSHSEGFSMAVLEALACGIPALVTQHCNFPELEDERAGIICEAERKSILYALQEMMDMSTEFRKQMGVHGRRLVEGQYTWVKVVAQLNEVYRWINGDGGEPDCVIVD